MPIDDDWNIAPTRVYMNPDDYRDMVVLVLLNEGWSESEALAEADRRLAEMLPPPDEPDPLLLKFLDKMEAGEG